MWFTYRLKLVLSQCEWDRLFSQLTESQVNGIY